jgi:hypothetical protein
MAPQHSQAQAGKGPRDAHLMVARQIAHEVLDMDCCIASKHIKG